VQNFLYDQEFMDGTENLIISPSSSDEEDPNETPQTEKGSIHDAIIRSIKKKKSEGDSSGKKIFDNAEQKLAI
jgi:hypothetical protein